MKHIQRFAGLLPLVFFLASCSLTGFQSQGDDDTPHGILYVTIRDSTGRTVVPQDMTVASYRLSGTGPMSRVLPAQTSSTGAFRVDDLAPGAWTVTVEGLDGSGNAFLSGSASVTVVAGNVANASVRLAPIFTGTGSVSLSLSWPAGHAVDAVSARIERLDTGSSRALPVAISGNGASGILDPVDAGPWLFFVELKNEGVKVARTVSDTVLVFPGKGSAWTIALSDSDFATGATITYYSNGAETGTVPKDVNFYASGDSATILGNTGSLWRHGYSFAGWDTEAGGTGDHYDEGDTLAMGSSDVALHAVWIAKATHRVVYHGNGNDGGDPPVDETDYYSGDEVVLSTVNTAEFFKTGLEFVGWCESPAGTGPRYLPYETFVMDDEDANLYAVWSRVLTAGPEIPPINEYYLEISGDDVVARGATETYSVDLWGATGYRWSLDGARLEGETSPSVTITFAAEGPHILTSFVTDEYGYVVSASLSIWVTN